MAAMGEKGDSGPQQAATAEEFIAALRDLKERSGLTYRQLEDRAAERGEVLARSTLAEVLGGRRAPRPELLGAFVRACGDVGRADEWIEAWEALARKGAGPTAVDERARFPVKVLVNILRLRVPSRVVVVAMAVAALTAAVTAWSVLSTGDAGDGGKAGNAGDGGPAAASASVWPRLPGGRVQIRPVVADGMCVTDGRVRGYEPLVAVQRPCGETAPQETLLEPLGGSNYRIRWYHPDHGRACLKALDGTAVAGLLEPWEACDQASRFHIEPTGADGSRRYTLRVEGQGCMAVKGAKKTANTAVVMRPCEAKPHHVFVIKPAP